MCYCCEDLVTTSVVTVSYAGSKASGLEEASRSAAEERGCEYKGFAPHYSRPSSSSFLPPDGLSLRRLCLRDEGIIATRSP